MLRTLVQPFLLCFVFLYVFPKIGQGIGGGGGTVDESAFATVLVPGVVGISIMFQGVQSVALQLSPGVRLHPRDRGPGAGAVPDLAGGGRQGAVGRGAGPALGGHRAPDRLGRARLRGAGPPDPHWALVLTLVPLACVAMASLGLVLGTAFEPRNIGLMFGFIVLPITFLGGTYYQWTKLAPVQVGGLHWLQTLVLINPLIYINEGMRAAFTHASHMHLYVIYPVLVGFCAVFLAIGLRKFRGRVLS